MTDDITPREQYDRLFGNLPDHFRYADDFEAWIKDNPPQPPTPEQIAFNKRRLAAIARMNEEMKGKQ